MNILLQTTVSIKKSLKYLSLAFISFFFFTSNSNASYENELVPHNPDKWIVDIAPYYWVDELEGDIASVTNSPVLRIDSEENDIDAGLSILTNAYKGDYSIRADATIVDIKAPVSSPVGPTSGVAETKSAILTLTGGYALNNTQRNRFELLYGARLWNTYTIFYTQSGANPTQKYSDKEIWIDPIIGLRNSLNFWKRVNWTISANVGGLKATGSEFSWEIFNGLGFRFNKRIMLKTGYRHLEVDYDKNGIVYDVEHSGPWVGLKIGLGNLD